MPREGYIRDLRAIVGERPLLMPSVATMVHDVVDGRDTIVVGRHRDLDRWVLPGGGVEPGEPPADCAVREVWEETGLHVELTGLSGVYGGTQDHRVTYPNGDVCDYVVTVFDARVVGGRLQPTDELAEVRQVTVDELAAMPIPAWLAAMLRHPDGWEPVTWQPPAP